MTSQMEFVNQRLNRIDETQAQQTQDIAEITGTLKSIGANMDTMRLALEKLTTSSDKTGLLQKGLMAAIIVQSLLHGITTPELAQQLIKQLFGSN